MNPKPHLTPVCSLFPKFYRAVRGCSDDTSHARRAPRASLATPHGTRGKKRRRNATDEAKPACLNADLLLPLPAARTGSGCRQPLRLTQPACRWASGSLGEMYGVEQVLDAVLTPLPFAHGALALPARGPLRHRVRPAFSACFGKGPQAVQGAHLQPAPERL